MTQTKRQKAIVKIADSRILEDKQLLFLCGLHRSGTTIIHDHLRTQLHTAYLQAPVPENEGQFLQNVFPQAFLFGGTGRFSFHREMNPPPEMPQSALRKRELLLGQWSHWTQERDSNLFIEKSPPNLTKTAFLRSIFPKAKFIVITRHPAAVAGATQKWARTSIVELLLHWHVAHKILLQDEDLSYHLVRYEDFCKSPKDTINQAICALNLQQHKREIATPVPIRFQRVQNTNGKYMRLPIVKDSFKRVLQYIENPSWQHFGYESNAQQQK